VIYFPDVEANNFVEPRDALLIIGLLRHRAATSATSYSVVDARSSNAAVSGGEGEQPSDERSLAVSGGERSRANVASSMLLPLADAVFAESQRSDTELNLLATNQRRQSDNWTMKSSRLARYDSVGPIANNPLLHFNSRTNGSSSIFVPVRDRMRRLEFESVLSDIVTDISDQWKTLGDNDAALVEEL
jgi:hypothetical protein